MSMEVVLTAVSEDQERRLRRGEITTGDLVTPSEANYTGEGDVTYLGCGCLYSMVAAFIAFSARGLFGHFGMLTTFVVCEIIALWLAWEFYRLPRRGRKPPDADLLIPEDARIGLTFWHGIHFLLTGTPWDGDPPLSFLLHGGTELRWHEYGPERLLSPREVAAAWNAISSMPTEELLSRYNAEEMNRLRLYPFAWDSEHERAGLARDLDDLRQFLGRAVETGSSVVLVLS